jgi:hypothetical protein
MAGMNLGMSERNDTMAGTQKCRSSSKFELGRKQYQSWTPCFHASRKELTRLPLTGAGGVIAAATHAPSPFVAPEAGVSTAVYAAEAMLHGQRKRRVRNAGGEGSLTA